VNIFHYTADRFTEGQTCLRQCRSKAGIGGEAGVGVDFENPGVAGVIDTEINSGVTIQCKQMPAFFCKFFQRLEQQTIFFFEDKSARRMAIGEG